MGLTDVPPPSWNPRYLAFCTATGDNPLSPRAPNHEYIGWINARWKDWRTEHNRHGTPTTDADHAAFDVWLWTRVRAERGAL
jgi:hypothetical protein